MATLFLEGNKISKTPLSYTEFTGYAAIFSTVDNHNDIFYQGCFDKYLKENNQKYLSILYGHDKKTILGATLSLTVDEHGLRVKGYIDRVRHPDIANRVISGDLDGLSVGYRSFRSVRRNGLRIITEAVLIEISIVEFPAHNAARIEEVT